MNLTRLVLIFLICIIQISLNLGVFSPYSGNTTLKWISSDEEFSSFYNLIKHNSEALNKFVEEEITIFVPTNEALRDHQSSLYSDFGLYHMASSSKDLTELKKTINLTSVNKNLPKLWISTFNDNEIFINNAKVVNRGYFSTSRSLENKILTQSIFMIDQILDPMMRSPPRPHTALDFLHNREKWGFWEQATSVSLFKFRIGEKKMDKLFSDDGGNTYFLPIDKEITPRVYNDINEYSIKGHIIPNLALFTRPVLRNVNYETMANDENVYMVASFLEIDSKLYIKTRTVFGNAENPEGEYLAEILYSDIPTANGVVHVISKPIGIFKRPLKPFPYGTVLNKLSTDIELSTFYDIGRATGFNTILTLQNKSFTLFAPNDFSWRQMRKQNLEYYDSPLDILKRHLIISDAPFSMERLYSLSNGSTKNGDVELQTAGGLMKVKIHKKPSPSGDIYYIQWYNKLVKVIRANYECSDGIVHVIAGPFASLHRFYYGNYSSGCC